MWHKLIFFSVLIYAIVISCVDFEAVEFSWFANFFRKIFSAAYTRYLSMMWVLRNKKISLGIPKAAPNGFCVSGTKKNIINLGNQFHEFVFS